MEVYRYTQLATRAALSLSLMLQHPIGAALGFSPALILPLCLVKTLPALGLLVGYKTQVMAAVTAFLHVSAIGGLCLYGTGEELPWLSVEFILFTAALVLYRDQHYYWSIDSLLEHRNGLNQKP